MSNLYAGDIKADYGLTAKQSVRANSTPNNFESKSLQYRTYAMSFDTPVNITVCIMRVYDAMTLVKVGALTDAGTISLQVNKRSTPTATGTDMLNSTLSVSSTWNSTTSFAATSISADDWIVLKLTSKSGTINYLQITIVTEIA